MHLPLYQLSPFLHGKAHFWNIFRAPHNQFYDLCFIILERKQNRKNNPRFADKIRRLKSELEEKKINYKFLHFQNFKKNTKRLEIWCHEFLQNLFLQ